jgi:hypothetical protein
MFYSKIKVGDQVLCDNEMYVVVWLDDSGVSDLVGLQDSSGKKIVVSFAEKIILKTMED